jgi:hypothetical protein
MSLENGKLNKIILDGNIVMDMNKQTNNTTVLKQYAICDSNYYQTDTYIHHNKGKGRIE